MPAVPRVRVGRLFVFTMEQAAVQVVLIKEVVVAGVDVRPVADDKELGGRLTVRVVPLPVCRREDPPRYARACELAEAATWVAQRGIVH